MKYRAYRGNSWMKPWIFLIVVLLLIGVLLSGCWQNIDNVKQHATDVWKSNGFTVVGYQGYNAGTAIPLSPYGGAFVWYTLKKSPDNGLTYEGAIQRWGNEYHIYSLKAKDAIQPGDK